MMTLVAGRLLSYVWDRHLEGKERGSKHSKTFSESWQLGTGWTIILLVCATTAGQHSQSPTSSYSYELGLRDIICIHRTRIFTSSTMTSDYKKTTDPSTGIHLPGSLHWDPSTRIPPSGSFHRDPSIGIPPLGSLHQDPSIRIPPSGSLHRDPSTGIPPPGSLHQDPSIGVPPPGSLHRDPSIGVPPPVSLHRDPSTGIHPSGFIHQMDQSEGSHWYTRVIRHGSPVVVHIIWALYTNLEVIPQCINRGLNTPLILLKFQSSDQ